MMLDESLPSPSIMTQMPDKPVVAILTIDDDLQLFRGNRQNFADLIRTGEKMGFITYVVTVKNLKLRAPRVLGYTFRTEDETWVKNWFPRPGIVYNRIPQREDERLPHVQRKLQAIAKQPGVQLFNRRFFNKWSLFQWLKQTRVTRRYIPATEKLTELAVLARLLKRYPVLYLKPVRGKAGVGIMTVSIHPEKQLPFRLQIQEEKGSRTYRLSTLQRVWERVCKYSTSIAEPYIAQQGIRLASINDRPFDLRALVQKNASGRWELSGIGARVAGNASITTHVPRGGNVDDPDKLLTAIFGKEKAGIVLSKVRGTTVLLAKRIERASRSRLAEMSMDLGVDENGDVWFFEANSKPMKFDESHIRHKSLMRIFQYSLYLHRHRLQLKGGSAAHDN